MWRMQIVHMTTALSMNTHSFTAKDGAWNGGPSKRHWSNLTEEHRPTDASRRNIVREYYQAKEVSG